MGGAEHNASQHNALQQLRDQLDELLRESPAGEDGSVDGGSVGARVTADIAQGAARLDGLLAQLDAEVVALMHSTAADVRADAEELHRRAELARSSLTRST